MVKMLLSKYTKTPLMMNRCLMTLSLISLIWIIVKKAKIIKLINYDNMS
nr:MAG TPA: hypothetical protein [Caudoviricetes sp.]